MLTEQLREKAFRFSIHCEEKEKKKSYFFLFLTSDFRFNIKRSNLLAFMIFLRYFFSIFVASSLGRATAEHNVNFNKGNCYKNSIFSRESLRQGEKDNDNGRHNCRTHKMLR